MSGHKPIVTQGKTSRPQRTWYRWGLHWNESPGILSCSQWQMLQGAFLILGQCFAWMNWGESRPCPVPRLQRVFWRSRWVSACHYEASSMSVQLPCKRRVTWSKPMSMNSFHHPFHQITVILDHFVSFLNGPHRSPLAHIQSVLHSVTWMIFPKHKSDGFHCSSDKGKNP